MGPPGAGRVRGRKAGGGVELRGEAQPHQLFRLKQSYGEPPCVRTLPSVEAQMQCRFRPRSARRRTRAHQPRPAVRQAPLIAGAPPEGRGRSFLVEPSQAQRLSLSRTVFVEIFNFSAARVVFPFTALSAQALWRGDGARSARRPMGARA